MITESVAISRLLVSFLLGACIGVERQIHRHPAGLRTFTLICMGSTLAMLVSIYICQTNLNLINGDNSANIIAVPQVRQGGIVKLKEKSYICGKEVQSDLSCVL